MYSSMPQHDHDLQNALLYSLGLPGMIISVFGIISNIISLLVYSRRRAAKRNSSLFFMALSAFDLLYLLIFLCVDTIHVVIFKRKETTFILQAENYVNGISNIVVTGSVFFTAALTVERCVAVSRPLRWALICSKKHSYVTGTLLTMAAVLVNLPLFLDEWEHRGMKRQHHNYYNNYSHHGNASGVTDYNNTVTATCNKNERGSTSDSHGHLAWYLKFVLPLFQLMVPGVIIITSTIVIIFSIRHHKVGQGPTTSNQSNSLIHKSANRITLQVIIMAALTLVCNGLLASSFIVTALDGTVFVNECSASCVVYVGFSRLAVAVNASVNLFLYCYFSKWFRDDAKTLFESGHKFCLCRVTRAIWTSSVTPYRGHP